MTEGFLAIWLMVPSGAGRTSSTSSKGISGMDTESRVPARKLAEWLDVDYRTAWYMSHRIRRLLSDPDWRKLSGIVEADGHAVGAPRQMYVGGHKKPEDDYPGAGSGGSKRGLSHGRAVVLVATERGGDVRVRRIAAHSSIEVGNAVRDLIEPSAHLVTNGLPAYRTVGPTTAEHVTVDHGRRRLSNGGGDHINTAEGPIFLFRRSVQGTWHWVSRKHLDAYTTECAWRHNRRGVSAATAFIQALGGLDAVPLGDRELVACG
ncbi:IS1595 family transposase [Rhodovibrio sodomensis]|uniref:IS1595 family transposase n=1 Tax=Rhodovibrio sodomensis TaxID=1088 RepID=UPI001A9128A2|nr:IS1595 family transposase [Rhodovibrio sodomensis]